MWKGTHFCKKARLRKPGFFVYLSLIPKGGQRYPAVLRRFCAGDGSGFPALVGTVVVLRQRAGWSSEHHALVPCRRDALRLTLADVGALVLCDKGRRLEYDRENEHSGRGFDPAGVFKLCNIQITNIIGLAEKVVYVVYRCEYDTLFFQAGVKILGVHAV